MSNFPSRRKWIVTPSYNGAALHEGFGEQPNVTVGRLARLENPPMANHFWRVVNLSVDSPMGAVFER